MAKAPASPDMALKSALSLSRAVLGKVSPGRLTAGAGGWVALWVEGGTDRGLAEDPALLLLFSCLPLQKHRDSDGHLGSCENRWELKSTVIGLRRRLRLRGMRLWHD